jgi:hypothetical protein
VTYVEKPVQRPQHATQVCNVCGKNGRGHNLRVLREPHSRRSPRAQETRGKTAFLTPRGALSTSVLGVKWPAISAIVATHQMSAACKAVGGAECPVIALRGFSKPGV